MCLPSVSCSYSPEYVISVLAVLKVTGCAHAQKAALLHVHAGMHNVCGAGLKASSHPTAACAGWRRLPPPGALLPPGAAGAVRGGRLPSGAALPDGTGGAGAAAGRCIYWRRRSSQRNAGGGLILGALRCGIVGQVSASRAAQWGSQSSEPQLHMPYVHTVQLCRCCCWRSLKLRRGAGTAATWGTGLLQTALPSSCSPAAPLAGVACCALHAVHVHWTLLVATHVEHSKHIAPL